MNKNVRKSGRLLLLLELGELLFSDVIVVLSAELVQQALLLLITNCRLALLVKLLLDMVILMEGLNQ